MATEVELEILARDRNNWKMIAVAFMMNCDKATIENVMKLLSLEQKEMLKEKASGVLTALEKAGI